MDIYPQGYHVTWGTYGTRLRGSNRPHVDRFHNAYGTPFAPTNPVVECAARERMKFAPVHLGVTQRKDVESALIELAERFGWTIHAIAVQAQHVHSVITATREGEALRDAMKAAASRCLNVGYGKRRWWAEGGSARYLWERYYFLNAIDYVEAQREL